VLWRCSGHGASSGQGELRVLKMELEIGGVPAVLSGAMIPMGRLLEKLGPQRLFTRVRGRGILRSLYAGSCIVAPSETAVRLARTS
jgi:hypothetical protein